MIINNNVKTVKTADTDRTDNIVNIVNTDNTGKSQTTHTRMSEEIAISIKNLNFWYGEKQALFDISLDVPKQRVTALIGPSGCGKSTLLRCLNRMNDLIPIARAQGSIMVGDENLDELDPVALRKRVGMVFQKPNPFPMSIYDNIAYGPRTHGLKDKKALDDLVEKCLKDAALYDEVAGRLHESAMGLSGGQQQRLCIARTLAVEPEIILFDEPCSALDPISTAKIEDLINVLEKKYPIIIVTHNMQQAARVSDYTGFFFMGKLIEFDRTKAIFENPAEKETEDYITGRFG